MFHILYFISIILVVFVLFTHINVPFYKSCVCGLMYICVLFHINCLETNVESGNVDGCNEI